MLTKNVLAIDLGASSGRAVVGSFDEGKIRLTEIHRFSNDPVTVGGTMYRTMYWDVLRLLYEIKQSLVKAKPYNVTSVAVDTWGVDFGLLDKDGRLLENPVHYRDSRTVGMLDSAFELVGKDELYQATGNQFMEINTAFQLLSIAKQRPDLLERADKLLLMPDLFAYFLCGAKNAELSAASTTQLFDPVKKVWADGVLEKLGIKRSLMPDIIPSGSVVGKISEDICEELDIEPIDVIAVCGHDTQCALAAAPAKERDFLFLSSGTWSLLGTELDKPLINQSAFALNVTNELGCADRTSFLKNMIGLWLIQESRRRMAREGREYSFAQLEEMARAAQPFKCFIDPDAPEFTPAGNIPRRIKEYCQRTGQSVPLTDGEVMRCIYESLALKYRMAKQQLEECTGKRFPAIYVVGGGTKDKFLSQLTACACGCEVSSGPVEATALGNVAIQLMAQGDIASLELARAAVRASEKIDRFEPFDTKLWDEAYRRFTDIIG